MARGTPSNPSTKIASPNRYLPQVGRVDYWRTKHPLMTSRSPSRSHLIRSLCIRPKTSMLILTTIWLIIKVTPVLKSSQATLTNSRALDRRHRQPSMPRLNSNSLQLEVISKVINHLLAMSRINIHTPILYTQTTEMEAIISAKTLLSMVEANRKTHKIRQEIKYTTFFRKRHQHMILLLQNMEAALY